MLILGRRFLDGRIRRYCGLTRSLKGVSGRIMIGLLLVYHQLGDSAARQKRLVACEFFLCLIKCCLSFRELGAGFGCGGAPLVDRGICLKDLLSKRAARQRGKHLPLADRVSGFCGDRRDT